MYTKVTFEPEKYGKEAFNRSTSMLFQPFNIQQPTGFPIEIENNEVITSDSQWLPHSTNTTFQSLHRGISFYDQLLGHSLSNRFLLQLTLRKNKIERKVYNIFDWANEIGGFYGFCELIVVLLLPFFQVWSLNKFLIKQLYTRRRAFSFKEVTRPTDGTVLPEAMITQLGSSGKLRPNKEFPCIAWLKRCFLRCCKSLKRQQADLHNQDARQKLERELDVLGFIRNMRLMRSLSRLVLTARERKLVRIRTFKRTTLDPFGSDESSDVGNG